MANDQMDGNTCVPRLFTRKRNGLFADGQYPGKKHAFNGSIQKDRATNRVLLYLSGQRNSTSTSGRCDYPQYADTTGIGYLFEKPAVHLLYR
ncbi:MAG: hypothetical protein PW786_11170 [Arachidicoccus sp.]|nr:hypothetical protein [Arachidicoccus sp.]